MNLTKMMRIGLVLLGISCTLTVRADYYVAQNLQTPSSPYTNWTTAASNIQDAVNQVALYASETIWIDSGRYTVPTNAVYDYYGTNIVHVFNKKISFRGFSGDPADTVIDGEGKYRGFAAVYDGSAPQGFTFDSLTISNCLTTNYVGGSGIYFYSGTRSKWLPWTSVVENCVFTHNQAVRGGGVHFHAEGPGRKLAFSNCVFQSNQASESGGAIWTYDALELDLLDCLFEKNEAAANSIWSGRFAAPRIDRCVIIGNSSDNGGMFLEGNGAVRNTLISHNVSSENGILRMSGYGSFDIENCTIVSNTVGASYGAVFLYGLNWGPTCRVVNCVMDANSDWDIRVRRDDPYDPYYGTLHVSNTCLSLTNHIPDFGSGNNITNDPKFVNFDAGDFRLANGSPCLDAGTNLPWTADAIDLDGNPRRDTVFGLVDMGAYEHLYRGTLILVQ